VKGLLRFSDNKEKGKINLDAEDDRFDIASLSIADE